MTPMSRAGRQRLKVALDELMALPRWQGRAAAADCASGRQEWQTPLRSPEIVVASGIRR